MRMQNNSGFTLVEMMISVLLLALMLSIGVPSFVSMFQRNNLTTLSNQFVSSIALARSEAVNRNTTIVLCQLNDLGNACDNDNEWEDGWVVWIDLDGDGIYEPENALPGEVSSIAVPPFRLITAIQDCRANVAGRAIALLFNHRVG